MRREVQVVATVLSIDADNDPDFPALIGASLALATSDIPWDGPISAIRIGLVDNELKVNPTYQERNNAQLDFFLSSADNKITMLEAGSDEVPEEKIIQATHLALIEIEKLQKFQLDIISQMAKPKTDIVLKQINPDIRTKTKEFIQDKLEDAIYTPIKMGRVSKLNELKKNLEEKLKSEGFDANTIKEAFVVLEEEIDALVHKNILEKEKRPDGRALDEIRPLHCEIGLIPRVHGSGFLCEDPLKLYPLLLWPLRLMH